MCKTMFIFVSLWRSAKLFITSPLASLLTLPYGDDKLVQETIAQIWPNLALEYICRFMIDCLSPDSSLFKSAGCQTVNFGQLILFAFEKKK